MLYTNNETAIHRIYRNSFFIKYTSSERKNIYLSVIRDVNIFGFNPPFLVNF